MMDRLRNLLNYVSSQLKVLNLSQRLALGMSAALIVVSILWLLQWSGEPDMVPLVNYSFTYDELDTVEAALQEAGATYSVRGRRIFVKVADKDNLVRIAHAADALPEGSLYDMMSVVQDPNPFENESHTSFKQIYAIGNELAKIIQSSPKVSEARVVINNSERKRLHGMGHVASATVSVKLAAGREMTQGMVESFAKLVASAIPGLKPYNVTVTDLTAMQSHSVPHPDDAGGVDVLSKKKQHEASFGKKIRMALAHIPGLNVAVNVDLSTSKSVLEEREYNSPEVQSELSDSSEQSSSKQPTEPGVQPNLGTAVTAGPTGGSNSREKTETRNFGPNIISSRRTEQPAFDIERVTATIGIPRSFIVGVFQAANPDATEPPSDTNSDYVTLRDSQVLAIKDSVKTLLQASDQDVRVNVYPDMEWTGNGGGFAPMPGGVAASMPASGEWDTMAMLERYGPQGGLGLLALMSLGMMMRVVRKSADELAGDLDEDEDEEEDEEIIFDAGSHAVGEASAPSSFLVGREVNDDVLRVQEITDEVAKMVDDDPSGAADLVNRWINEDF